MKTTDIKPGRVLAGRWRVLTRLGDEQSPSFRVRDDDGLDAELIILRDQARITDSLAPFTGWRHENIIAAYESGPLEEPGSFYLIRELVTGQTVAEWLRREGRLGYDQALGIACQLCLASTEAHGAGVPFLGFHPGHVTVSADGFAKADPLRLRAESDGDFLSPEEQRGEEPTQRSDLFRIGLFVHRMFRGRLPARDRAGRALLQPLSEEFPDLPTELDAALAKALAGDPEGRFTDAEDMLDTLHALLMNRPRPASAGPARWYEDKRFWLYTAIALSALVTALILFGHLFV